MDGCGAAQLLGVDGAWQDPVPAALSLLYSWHSWLYSPPSTVTRDKMAVPSPNLGVKALLGDQISPGRTGVQTAVEQPSS